MRSKILGLLAGVAVMAMPAAAHATSIFGSLGNFDAVNDTGSIAHGFEIELEGIHAGNVTDTFGGAGRGFPTTVERYGAPTITEYSSGSIFGVRVTYGTSLAGAPSSWIGTPSGVYSTPGESCWTGGGIGYGASTPCDHFGVGLSANPTRTKYSWLVEQTPGSASLVNAVSNVLAPTWTVTPQAPPAPGNPAPPPVIVAQIVAPPANFEGPEPQFGTAIWAKVFTTEIEGQVKLDDLLGGNAFVQQAAQNTETEWQLLQTDPGNPLSGILENGGAAPAGDKAQSIIRRYEFYAFNGLYDPVSHEAQFGAGFGDSLPGPGDVGNFIGAQNAALNFAAPVGGGGVGGVPEPASWAMMLLGFGGIGGAVRARRKRTVAA